MINRSVINSRVFKLIVSLAITLVFFCAYNFMTKNYSEILLTDDTVNQCYDAKMASNGHIILLDSGHSRILDVDKDNVINRVIYPDGYVDNMILASDDSIWTQESYWDGMWISGETINHYTSDGKEELLSYDYSNNIISKHAIYGLSVSYGTIRYAKCGEDVVRIFTNSGDEESTQDIIFEDAENAVADISIVDQLVYILLKNGSIYKVSLKNVNKKELIYRISSSKEELSRVPFKIFVNNQHEVFYTDIRNRSIQKVTENVDEVSETIISDTNSNCVSLYKVDGKMLCMLSEADGLHIVNDGETKVISKLIFNQDFINIRSLKIIVLILFIASLLVFAYHLLRLVISKLTNSRLLLLITMILTFSVSCLIIHMLIDKFTETYSANIYNQLEIAAYVASNRISVDDINNVDTALDYGNDSYNRICNTMDESYPQDVEFNKNLYCNILKRNEKGESYSIAYFDQTIGVYYPLDEIEQAEVDAVYETKKAMWNEAKEDISGTYLYVKVPVFDNDNNVGGVVAVGIPVEVLTDTISGIRNEILTSSIVILLLLFMAITQITQIFDLKNIYDRDIKEEGIAFPGYLFKLLIIVVFAAYNMSATFLPVYILTRIPKNAINPELLASLPITINIFIIGIMSLFCQKLISKFSLGKVLSFSAVLSMLGNAIIYLFPNYFGIAIGLILDGIGVGIITNTCYIIITYIEDPVAKVTGLTIYNSSSLAGINIGMLLGSIIAINIEEKNVFLFVVATWAVAILVTMILFRKLKPMLADSLSIASVSRIKLGEFIRKPEVNLFMLLMQNPAIVFNAFVYYYLPIYCYEQGLGVTIVSILFIIYIGLATITGDAVLKYLDSKFKSNTMYIAYALNIAAVLIYAIAYNPISLIIALALLGISAGFCKPSLQNYFIGLDAVKDYGEDRSIGVYNFTENIGESLGPTIFAQLMAFSPIIASIAPFSLVVAACGTVHFIFKNKILKKETNN